MQIRLILTLIIPLTKWVKGVGFDYCQNFRFDVELLHFLDAVDAVATIWIFLNRVYVLFALFMSKSGVYGMVLVLCAHHDAIIKNGPYFMYAMHNAFDLHRFG